MASTAEQRTALEDAIAECLDAGDPADEVVEFVLAVGRERRASQFSWFCRAFGDGP